MNIFSLVPKVITPSNTKVPLGPHVVTLCDQTPIFVVMMATK